MKTKINQTLKSLITTLAVVVLISFTANAQTSKPNNPVKKIIEKVQAYKLSVAESNILQLTNLVAEKVKYKAPTVSDNDYAKPVLLSYSTSYKKQTEKKEKSVSYRKLSANEKISDTQYFRAWFKDKLERRLGDIGYQTKGNVVVNFTIDETGKLQHPSVTSATDKTIERIIIELLGSSPQWSVSGEGEEQFYMPVTYIVR